MPDTDPTTVIRPPSPPLVVFALPEDRELARREFGFLPGVTVLSPKSKAEVKGKAAIVMVGPGPFEAYVTILQLVRSLPGIIRAAVYTPEKKTGVEGFELGQVCHGFSGLVEGRKHLSQWVTTIGLQRPEAAFKIVDVRNRLGFTQKQMGKVLNVDVRTIQNWEKEISTGQIENKAKQLRRLVELMDEFVVAPNEKKWLDKKLPALNDRTPRETILAGDMDTLIGELTGLAEGMPV